jgi:hypothetical protein
MSGFLPGSTSSRSRDYENFAPKVGAGEVGDAFNRVAPVIFGACWFETSLRNMGIS